MKIANYILTLVFIIGCNCNAFGQNVEQRLITEAERISGDRFLHTAKTKKGAKVFGVKKPSKEMLNSIDKGLTNLFAVASKNGFNKRLNYSDYTVFIANPDRLTDSDGNYIPNFKVPLNQYKGSDYDKGGFMYAAGIVMGYNPCAFMIAENKKKLVQVSDVVRYEGEHIVLYHNDRKRYNETADHSKGGSHPILQ
jgi:hypothetical protein